MFNEKILPKRASQRVRAQIFVSCFRSLDDQQISCLKSGLKRVVKFRALIARCMASRKNLKALNAKAFTEMSISPSASIPGNHEFEAATCVTAAMEQNLTYYQISSNENWKIFYEKYLRKMKKYLHLSSRRDPKHWMVVIFQPVKNEATLS